MKHSFEITENPGEALTKFLSDKEYSKFFVLVDENTEEHCYPILKENLPAHTFIKIQSGEENKNLQTCTAIWEAMTVATLDRNSLFINIGGGVISDMGGFCASTYKRGISFINFPTTLLSQVDASVGGKLGIDFLSYKNHIGVFKEPEHVIISPVFLKTLDKRELRSGYAEILKHAMIKDAKQWQLLKGKTVEDLDWVATILHSINIKKAVVESDPFEKGLRKILNWGHTIGHAIETKYLDREDGRMLHGEAIAVGMVCEAYLAVKKSTLTKTELEDISETLLAVFGKEEVLEKDFDEILKHSLQDKKNIGGEVKASLLKKIGDCDFDIVINGEDIKEAILYYNSLVVG